MKIKNLMLSLLALAGMVFFVTGCGNTDAGTTVDPGIQPDREYVFTTLMTGYVGRGGEIEGKKNPVLTARKGEVVRITIINGELMPHDIALKGHGAKSTQIIQKDETTSVTFTAEKDDQYYCTIPGHVQTGMIGEFRILEEATPVAQVTP